MRSIKYPRPERRMSALDAAFLYLDPTDSQFQIGCLALLQAPLSKDDLIRCVEARLGVLRRFTERVERAPLGMAHPRWESSPGFKVREHVHRWSVSSSARSQDLDELVANLMTRPLDRRRPLWEMHLVSGLRGGRTAVLHKAHHCMVDGVSGVGLLEHLLDREARPPRNGPPPPVVPGRSRSIDRFASALWDATERPARRGLEAVRTLLRRPTEETRARLAAGAAAASEVGAGWVRAFAEHSPELPWCGPLGAKRSLRFARLPMAGVAEIRRACGGTINDVVLSVLAGGLERYLQSEGKILRSRNLTALVPVSLRSASDSNVLGNRIVALRVPLALGEADEIARLDRIRATTGDVKLGSTLLGTTLILDALDFVPAPLFAWAADRFALPRGVADLIATNVPGPRERRFLAGRPVRSLYPIVPIVDGMGLAIAVLSYANQLHLGLHAATDLVPDLEKLESGILEAFQTLRTAAHES